MNASVLIGLVPSILYDKYGVKKTIFIGGLLLTAAHLMAALMLNSEKTGGASTILLFIVGVVGG